MAVVNVMKAFHTRGDRAEVAGVGLKLLGDDEALLSEFAEFVGSRTLDELRRAAAQAAAATTKRKKGAASSSSSTAAKKTKPETVETTWRVEGDDVLGHFFARDGSLARVDAWTRRQGRKHYRGTLLLGAQRGNLVEVSDTVLNELGHSAKVEDHLRAIPDFETLAGADAPLVRGAAEKLALAAKIEAQPGWSAMFEAVVWAQDKPTEPKWPAIVLDPIALDDPKLRRRAIKFLGAKHLVRFLGFPQSSSLGFVAPASLSPYADHDPEIDKAAKLARKPRARFEDAVNEAKVLTRKPAQNRAPPPLGAKIGVTYLGDDRVYACTVVRDPDTGELSVRSPDFGPDEPDTIPFDPNEDDWRPLEDPPPTAPAELASSSQARERESAA
ncbi:hypothetical protein CTAYLR_000299 [Chrysophaeum taylorii]|uniref:PWWP domain-containing protein n=1 Tax=Chrysophaeum taylorii TaxID=2483200 RepID=A0AAD7XM78_9STRA|nr:hypothetical protein CTAYLR_000299 [Chrysophaeum taylorii]